MVDDDNAIGEVVSQMLEMEGFAVKTFTNGKDSIEKISGENPDLILLDYFLPGENAEQTIREIKDNAQGSLPIILMSASVQAADKAKKLAVSEFIPKPFQRQALIDVIRRNIN